jgi:hypothetical protein
MATVLFTEEARAVRGTLWTGRGEQFRILAIDTVSVNERPATSKTR